MSKPSELRGKDGYRVMPECAECGLRKKPFGRSAGAAIASGLCDRDCPGYHAEPISSMSWPSEVYGEVDTEDTS